jgi:hypothetical protein
MSYRVNENFSIHCGFNVTAEDVLHATTLTNSVLAALPASLFRSIDFKTSSAVLGAIFCEHLADRTMSIVNPIEKGHPDILPASAAHAPEGTLRYHCGLEIKSTIGNISQGANLRAGIRRVEHMVGITWQAHHRDVTSLMGLTWDFVQSQESFNYPGITGIFYSSSLIQADWGAISGTTGRNTKVSGMRASGREKMGAGWVLLWNEDIYEAMFERLIPTSAKNSVSSRKAQLRLTGY